jgi:hypothetical protein
LKTLTAAYTALELLSELVELAVLLPPTHHASAAANPRGCPVFLISCAHQWSRVAVHFVFVLLCSSFCLCLALLIIHQARGCPVAGSLLDVQRHIRVCDFADPAAANAADGDNAGSSTAAGVLPTLAPKLNYEARCWLGGWGAWVGARWLGRVGWGALVGARCWFRRVVGSDALLVQARGLGRVGGGALVGARCWLDGALVEVRWLGRAGWGVWVGACGRLWVLGCNRNRPGHVRCDAGAGYLGVVAAVLAC